MADNPPTPDSQIQTLFAALESPDNATVINAVKQLAELRHTPALSALGRLLHHDNETVQQAAQDAILTLLLAQSGAERALIVLKDAEGGLTRHATDAALTGEAQTSVSGSIIEMVFDAGEAILTTNARQDAHFAGQDSITAFSLRSVAAVPIKAGDEVVGVAYFEYLPIRSGVFNNDDLAGLEKVANAIGAGLSEEKQADAQPPDEIIDDLLLEGLPLAPPIVPPLEPPSAPIAPPAQITDPGPMPPQPLPINTPRGGELAPTVRTVQFSAYQPREVAPEVWHPLTAYVYYADKAAEVEQDARGQLGAQLAAMRPMSKPAQVPVREGALITATPHLPGFQFNPPSASIAFYEDWHRFDFKLRAKDAPQYQAANGQITFTIEGLIVGHLPLSIYVGERPAPQAHAPQQMASLAAPQTTPHTEAVKNSANAYQAIFCSYSRRDLPIVERVEKAYKALGLEYLRDLLALRSGETWHDGLRAMIERADIFQLFWSSHSANSDHVRMEWQHALALGRGGAFIRPVHWEMPMPPAPPELAHLHFTYAPELGAS